MRDIPTWRKELFDEIRTISNRNELEQLWMGTDLKFCSSYSEEVEHIFDDFNIRGFLSLKSEQSGLTPTQRLMLQKFCDEFTNYVQYTNREHKGMPDPEVVLSDPRWSRIISLAQAFVRLIDEETNNEL